MLNRPTFGVHITCRRGLFGFFAPRSTTKRTFMGFLLLVPIYYGGPRSVSRVFCSWYPSTNRDQEHFLPFSAPGTWSEVRVPRIFGHFCRQPSVLDGGSPHFRAFLPATTDFECGSPTFLPFFVGDFLWQAVGTAASIILKARGPRRRSSDCGEGVRRPAVTMLRNSES